MITNEIGLNAGKIWNTLFDVGEQPVKTLIKKLKMTSPDFYMAVGWLAREEKIFHFEKDGVLTICLKD